MTADTDIYQELERKAEMTRHTGAVENAVKASREEDQLENLVAIVGTKEAQRAVQSHRLPTLVEEINGHE
ncbi:hypothetical protein [Streptomyces sp. NPDC055085]